MSANPSRLKKTVPEHCLSSYGEVRKSGDPCPRTPKKGLRIVAKSRSTRKGSRVNGLGGSGVDGRSYYPIVEQEDGSLKCMCPASLYRKGKLVRQTGQCKHLHALFRYIQDGAPRDDRKFDFIIYDPTLRRQAGLSENKQSA